MKGDEKKAITKITVILAFYNPFWFFKILLEQMKTNKMIYLKKSDFVDSGFVKTCDELVIGYGRQKNMATARLPLPNT